MAGVGRDHKEGMRRAVYRRTVPKLDERLVLHDSANAVVPQGFPSETIHRAATCLNGKSLPMLVLQGRLKGRGAYR